MSIDSTTNKLLIFIVIMLVFKIQAQDNSIVHAIISGKITNVKDKVFVLKGLKDKIKTTLEFDEKGNFSVDLTSPKQEFVLFEGINKAYIYLNPGDRAYLTANADNFLKSLKFTGDSAPLNNYDVGTDNLYLEENRDFKQKYSQNESEFSTSKKEWIQKYYVFLENSPGLTKEFKKIEKRNIYYGYVRDFIRYEKFHKKYVENNDFVVSENFLDEFKNLDWNNEQDYKDCHFYSHLISDRINSNFEKEKKTDENKLISKIKYINKSINNQYIKDQLLFKNSEYNITYTENFQSFYQAFLEGVKDPELKSKITKTYKSLVVLAKGKTSPKFINYENYLGGTSSLDDFKGHYVYIHIWASWCPPCTKEIPDLSKLNNKFKQITFVSISVDEGKDKSKWREMVKEKNMNWVQLYSDKNWSSEFIKAYLIKGIPRNIIIDPQGKIVSANAPRPSDEKLTNLFNELKI
ncbi:MAG: TlpA family protein disulfide reductase [Flavobacteriaceae bacterium]|nr:TlpA family protein disulfide reductase [Flavobacteriaceae bacterium]